MRFRSRADDADQSDDLSHDLIDKLERLEGRARHDFFAGGYGQCSGRTLHSCARLVAFDVLNAATPTVTERRLFALVDGAALLLIHGAARSRPGSAWRP
jgi:hypothetical protein